jgi:hypothetical protein
VIVIIIILFFILSLIVFFQPQSYNDRFYLFLFVCVVLIIVAGFRPEDSVLDYDLYLKNFSDIKSNTQVFIEPTFILISSLVNSSIYLFLIYAILGVSLKFIAIKQLSELWFLSVLIYLCNFYLLHELTQIRAGVASAILLLCVKPIYERNWKKFVFFALLGFSFHYSALVIFPLWFLGHEPRKKWLILSIPISYMIYFLGINLVLVLPIPGIQEKLETYKSIQELGDEVWNSINVFNLLFLTRITIFYFLLWKYDLVLRYNKYLPILIKIYCISLMTIPIFATMPVVAFRVNEFIGIIEIILIPLMFYVLRPVYFSRAVILFIGLCLMLIVLFYNKLILY